MNLEHQYEQASVAKICRYNDKFDTNCRNVTYILITVCTYNRLLELKRALRYIERLELPKEDIKIDVMIIDNDEKQSALNIVTEFKNNSKFNVFYFLEHERGLSNVRNKMLKCAIELGASHIALFDDDEILDKNWLINHLSFYRENKECCVSSGIAYYRFNKKYPKHITGNKLFRQPKGEIKEILQCGCGNVFFPVSIAKQSNIYFDKKFVFTGGEDVDFFSRASNAGYKIFSNPSAIIYQIVDDDRANLKHILKRGFHEGFVSTLLMSPTKKERLGFKIRSAVNPCLRFLWLFISILGGRIVFINSLTHFMQGLGRFKAIYTKKGCDFYK